MQTSTHKHSFSHTIPRAVPYDFKASIHYQNMASNETDIALYPEEDAKSYCGLLKAEPGMVPAEIQLGRWYISKSGEYYYEPEMCRLRRLSAEEARTCLRDKYIIFVGDSISRYQYVSFVHFLSRRQYMERYANASQPSLDVEFEWNNFTEYFQGGSTLLSDVVDGEGEEICDCKRGVDWYIDLYEGKIWENRNFALHKYTIDGHKFIDSKLRVSYFSASDFPDLEHSALHAITRALRHRHHGEPSPDVVLLNVGLWAWSSRFFVPNPMSLRYLVEDLLETGKALAKNLMTRHPVQLFWKSTTPLREWTSKDGEIEAMEEDAREIAKASQLWKVLDIRAIAGAALKQKLDIYVDKSHFIPVVYEQFNDLLLNHICEAGS